ncbi:MAG: GNAT family N-acetyltransferase [Rhodobacteraceae bacterium]|nr:GNAT family N-acetyltransferase [Paracoccaceae bacterium]
MKALKLNPLSLDTTPDADLEAAWRRLSKEACDPNPFFGPDFLRPFLRAMQDGKVTVHAITDVDGRWLVAAPFKKRRAGLLVPSYASYANEYAPLGLPLLSPQAPPEAITLFLNSLDRESPTTLFPYARLDAATAAALRSVDGWSSLETAPARRAAHDGGERGREQFAEAFRGKRKKELSRLKRRLEDEGPLVLESHYGDDVPEQFERFLDLEKSGWKGKNTSALASHEDTVAFSRQAIAAMAVHKGVRIDSMSVAGKPIAMMVVLTEGNRAFAWKIAYDETYAKFSPGAHLSLYALETNLANEALDGGDSLAVPGHPMIEPLWRGRMDYATLIYAKGAAPNLRQKLTACDIQLEKKLREIARKLLRRGA